MKTKDHMDKPIPTDLIEYQRVVSLIKGRVARWPSAYASGMVVQMYKKVMEKQNKQPYRKDESKGNEPTGLSRWYKEKWIDIMTGKPCGSINGKTSPSYYPTCRPSIRITSQTPVLASALSRVEKQKMIAMKQKAREKTVLYTATRNIHVLVGPPKRATRR